MDYGQRMAAVFAALDFQESPNYSQVAKKYELERTTLSKRVKGQTVSQKVFLSGVSLTLPTPRAEISGRSPGRHFIRGLST